MREIPAKAIGGIKRKGQATVEFALVSIILVAMLFGILEVGRLIFINSEIENAAREGARYAALHSDVNANSLRDTIYGKLTLADTMALNISGPNYPDGSRCSFCQVEVNVSYGWTSLVGMLGLGSIELRSSSTQLIEAP